MVSGTLYHEHQPDSFVFADKYQHDIKAILDHYPDGYKKSAIMPLLDLAQRQVGEQGPWGPYKKGGAWLPRVAMDAVAEIVGVPPIKVYEVATFYSMYNLKPIGQHHIQICGTTPCMLRDSEKILQTCRDVLDIDLGQTTPDGMFTLTEVECMGACCNAPMVQINDDYYEDLTPEQMEKLLNALAEGKKPPKGSQKGRRASAPEGELTSLHEFVSANADDKATVKTKDQPKAPTKSNAKKASKTKATTKKKTTKTTKTSTAKNKRK